MTSAPTPAALLPLNSTTLASDPRVLTAARELGARHGVDYTDDAAVTALLAERRRAMESAQRGPLAWLGGLALTAGALLPFLSSALPDRAAEGALLVSGPLLLIAVAALAQVRIRWKRELTHPALAGYREVLGVARAHGLAPAYVPAWLEGRRQDGSGKGAAPIPSYEAVEPYAAVEPYQLQPNQPYERVRKAEEIPPTEEEATQPHPPVDEPSAPTPPPIPVKPPAVISYEMFADQGGWHDEASCLLLLVGGAGALWAATSDAPIGYGALALVPVAVLVWLAGAREFNEKERLKAEALAYVEEIAAAQAAGAQVPELSPALKKLLDERS
ncbi:hypothetical protein ACWGI9_38940 [Streptomyces sp. NPDC054833]